MTRYCPLCLPVLLVLFTAGGRFVCGAEPVAEGLILHLDAEAQIQSGGRDSANNKWQNLATQPDRIAGSAVLHNFQFDTSSGWTGTGTKLEPYALRFDGEKTYVEGPGNLELADITLEAWASIEGSKLRGATLIGNDFGQGGISLIYSTSAQAILLLHERTFTTTGAGSPLGQWSQLVAVQAGDKARLFVNGRRVAVVDAPRTLQTEHRCFYQLGAARFPEMDYAAADSLIGQIAIARVYDRALTDNEVLTNFLADQERFMIPPYVAPEPVSSMPVPQVPLLGPMPAVRSLKWPYYDEPVAVSGPAVNGTYTMIQGGFDGFPTKLAHPYPVNQWMTDPAEKDVQPSVTIDYKRPVAVTRFVHYFDESRAPAAWKDVDILVSTDQSEWKRVQSLRNLPLDAPQVLGIDDPVSAQYYRIEIKALADDAKGLVTNEVETYYGATIGNIQTAQPLATQTEPYSVRVRVVNPDAAMRDVSIRLVAPPGALKEDIEGPVPPMEAGGGVWVTFYVTPLVAGSIPLTVEMRQHGALVDQRPYSLRCKPKLAFQHLSCEGAQLAGNGESLMLTGSILNDGTSPARGVHVQWMEARAELGDLGPGEHAPFEIAANVRPGYQEGLVVAAADNEVRSSVRRSVISPTAKCLSVDNRTCQTQWEEDGGVLRWTTRLKGEAESQMSGSLAVFSGQQSCPVSLVQGDGSAGALAAVVPGGVLLADLLSTVDGLEDQGWRCRVMPDDPSTLKHPWLDLELRLSVDQAQVMFRPHIDWYTVEHGPNFRPLTNGHNSATRMMTIETDEGTVTMVPDTDNLSWGFTDDHQMTVQFQIPLDGRAGPDQGRWRPVAESPQDFQLTLAAGKGNWWDAYRHVVTDIFQFEQPRQWAMPITQMQMLTVRELMSYEAWSERHQIVRNLTTDEWFWPMYGACYTLPALYSWHLATDYPTARIKAEKTVDWLLEIQHDEGPMAGAWFTSYFSDAKSNTLVGGDFIRNPWIIPHGTGIVVKTLLWYWDASGRKDQRVLAAAQRGCDWMLKVMRPDGGLPYAFTVEGQPITQACGAGQIWCTWALWRMYQVTGDEKLKEAALRSKDFFRKTYMDVHRYVGYWEDTVGITAEKNETILSWEAYEPAIATLVFSEMGDRELALAAAQDTATWSWTRVISTRQYETCLGQTTEQALCGPSQAQCPMVGLAFHEIYEQTGEKLWHDLSGATKSTNFCADPEQAYGMVATSGWCFALSAVAGPPYDNVRPFVTPNMSKGDYGRQLWVGWCTDQFAWLSLEWLIREGNIRASQFVKIHPERLRGTVLGAPGRIKMPEEKCEVHSYEHYDINWVGYQNDLQYALLVMNHKQTVRVAVRPHEAHLDVYSRPPRILVGAPDQWREVSARKEGIQYVIEIPENGNALVIWDRIK